MNIIRMRNANATRGMNANVSKANSMIANAERIAAVAAVVIAIVGISLCAGSAPGKKRSTHWKNILRNCSWRSKRLKNTLRLYAVPRKPDPIA